MKYLFLITHSQKPADIEAANKIPTRAWPFIPSTQALIEALLLSYAKRYTHYKLAKMMAKISKLGTNAPKKLH